MSNKTTTKKEAIKADNTAPETKSEKKPLVAKEIDMHQYITVRNGFQGKLTYKSPKTGEIFKWESFGDEQEIELLELKNAKNASKKFFENNWFMFDEEWVIDYLGLRQYYKHAIKIEDFDNIFKMAPDKIRETVSSLSSGQKKSLAYRARTLIAEEEIDSNKVISALEDSLGIALIEK